MFADANGGGAAKKKRVQRVGDRQAQGTTQVEPVVVGGGEGKYCPESSSCF